MQNVTIRLAIPSDASDMAEVLMRSWEAIYKNIMPADYIREKNATRPALYARVITDENTGAYVIQLCGKTVGIMKIAPPISNDLSDSFYELHYIYLHPDNFRMGIGSYAVRFAFRIARILGKTNVIVWCLSENTNAVKFYEKCGFIADGKKEINEYGRPMERMRMTKNL